jgi:hypothetical protein
VVKLESPAVDERALAVALRPWTRRLLAEATLRWLIRGGIGALIAGCLVLSVGWLTPFPIDQLRPIALELALPMALTGVLVGLWPASRLHRAAQLDRRLGLQDRLATAWLNRAVDTPMARLQRGDALHQLEAAKQLDIRLARIEALALAALAILSLALLVVPSPMEKLLRQIATEQLATEQAAERIDALRQEAVSAEALTPEQAKRLDELLARARQELGQTHTERAAAAVLARAAQDMQQLGDPNAEARDQALAAMSETLSQEPLARSLGDALQNNDSRATRDAIDTMRQHAGQLSEPQRQALSRALQRAANVGRADSRSSNALRDAARALAAGESPDAQMQEASASLEQAMQAAAAEAALRAAGQRLQDVRTELSQTAQGIQPSAEQPLTGEPGQSAGSPSLTGTPVPIDASSLRRGGAAGESRTDAAAERSTSGGVGGADLSQGQPANTVEPSESIFIPGRVGDGPSDNDAIQQPFTVRGAPRPYREVIGQYAQSGRDYVDRAEVPSSVREMVRQYFSDLEGN